MISNNDIYGTVKSISNFVETQFPAFYRENSATFIAFVKAYYEWLESPENPLYLTRRLYEIKDVDDTLDEFIVQFKEKYLKGIQFDTAANIRMIIKHALDIYRSKGTPQGVELLFNLVYQKTPKIYYPSTDLFKLSDGVWVTPIFLELTLNENNVLFEGKEIEGSISGAIAFVDRVIRTKAKGRLIDVIFMSAINGNFMTGEKLEPTDGSISIVDCPYIIGSLSDVSLPDTGSGENFTNGTIVTITSSTGIGAIGRVANTINKTGVLQIELLDGGFGYANTMSIYTSNVIFTLSNVTPTDTGKYFKFLDKILTPSANGLYIASDPNVILNLSNNVINFRPGELVTSNNGAFGTVQSYFNQELIVNNYIGVFYPSTTITGNVSGGPANVATISLTVGVVNVVGTFTTNTNANSTLVSNSLITRVFSGNGAQLTINTDTLLNKETISINTDLINAYFSVQVNALAYGLPGNTAANLTFSTINAAFGYANLTIGKIKDITFAPGDGYTHSPFVVVVQQDVLNYRKHDYQLIITGASSGYITGEVITQNSINVGIIKTGSNTSYLYVQNINFENQIIPTVNTSTQIIGLTSGITANVDPASWFDDDIDSNLMMGFNAKFEDSFVIGTGSLSDIVIIDSGYGFIDGQEVAIEGGATGSAVVQKQGTHQGYYSSIGGELSAGKKLFDGDFWQNFSYEIISPIMIQRYETMIKQLMHPAGTKLFGRFEYINTTDEDKQIYSDSIKIVVH